MTQSSDKQFFKDVIHTTYALVLIFILFISMIEESAITKYCKSKGYDGGSWSLLEGRYCIKRTDYPDGKWFTETFLFDKEELRSVE